MKKCSIKLFKTIMKKTLGVKIDFILCPFVNYICYTCTDVNHCILYKCCVFTKLYTTRFIQWTIHFNIKWILTNKQTIFSNIFFYSHLSSNDNQWVCWPDTVQQKPIIFRLNAQFKSSTVINLWMEFEALRVINSSCHFI